MERNFYFQWHLTERCNLRCRHCYQNTEEYQQHITLEDFELVLDRIGTALKKWNWGGRIALTGGEPLVIKSFRALVERLDEQPWLSFFDILSNGTLIDESTAAWLASLHRLRRIQISLDGATASSHNRIRGEEAFESALRGMRNLRKHGVDISIMFTLFRSNLDQIENILELAHREEAETISIERLVPIGRGQELMEELLTPEEIQKAYLKIWNLSKKYYEMGYSLKILKFRTLWAAIDPTHAHSQKDLPGTLQLGASCSIGFDSLCIMPDLTVLPCRRLPIPIGNLREDTLFKIWYSSPLLWKIRNKDMLEGKCRNCDLKAICGGCRAVTYSLTGDILGADPQCFYDIA